MKTVLDNSLIPVLHDIRNIPEESRDRTRWTFKVFYSDRCLPDNFLLPNRRAFYKIMLITGGTSILTIGLNTYYIEQAVMLFVHPNEIISWKNLSLESSAHYVLFKKAFVIRHPQFKAMLNKFGLFQNKEKNVISLKESKALFLSEYFERMEREDRLNDVYREDTIQALLQLLVLESIKAAKFLMPNKTSGEYSRTYQFFDLLEKETSGICFTNPIRIRTVKEFANSLHMHPNYLNVLLKKHTGQNVSVHIRNRLLDEAKSLLLYTNWNLQDIAYSIGFSEQSNFNFFFKKNTGLTPTAFRRSLN